MCTGERIRHPQRVHAQNYGPCSLSRKEDEALMNNIKDVTLPKGGGVKSGFNFFTPVIKTQIFNTHQLVTLQFQGLYDFLCKLDLF